MLSKVTSAESRMGARGIARWIIASFVGIPVLLLAGCSVPVTTGGDGGRTTTPAADKYTQTWTKSYSSTTCEDWQESMTAAQTWAAAADILTSARNKVDGGSGLPADSLITSFRDDISEGCSADVPGVVITNVAYGVYQIGHEQYGP